MERASKVKVCMDRTLQPQQHSKGVSMVDYRKSSISQKNLTNSIAPVQRMVLKDRRNMGPIITTSAKLISEILQNADIELRSNIVSFLQHGNVVSKLNQLILAKETFVLNDIINNIENNTKEIKGTVNTSMANLFANKIQITPLILTPEEIQILNYNLIYFYPNLKTKPGGQVQSGAAILEQKKQRWRGEFSKYNNTFNHIFKGGKNAKGRPTGYHQEGHSDTHETYGSKHDNNNGTYQQSVKLKGENTIKKNQSTFFPLGMSQEDVKFAVVSAATNNWFVQYPEEIEGLRLCQKGQGDTIYPVSNTLLAAEPLLPTPTNSKTKKPPR